MLRREELPWDSSCGVVTVESYRKSAEDMGDVV